MGWRGSSGPRRALAEMGADRIAVRRQHTGVSRGDPAVGDRLDGGFGEKQREHFAAKIVSSYGALDLTGYLSHDDIHDRMTSCPSVRPHRTCRFRCGS